MSNNQSQKLVLVTGANGFVGSWLCRELVDHGYRVRALHRATSSTETLKGLNLELVQGDITDRASLARVMAGCQVVYHLAALFRQAKFPDEVYTQVNVEGTRNVFEEAIAAGVSRVVYCSTTGVHGDITSPPAREDEAFRPADVYQRSKCEAEKLARQFFQSGAIRGVVIRPAMIWGPGDKRILKLFRGTARRKLPIIGMGETLFHWISITDLTRAFRLAGESTINDEVYIIGGERIVTVRQLYAIIAQACGVRVLPFRIPVFPLRLLGSIVEAVCVLFGVEPPIYRRRVDFFIKTRAFDCSKAQRDLGFKPEKSLEEEVAWITAWYREAGWL